MRAVIFLVCLFCGCGHPQVVTAVPMAPPRETTVRPSLRGVTLPSGWSILTNQDEKIVLQNDGREIVIAQSDESISELVSHLEQDGDPMTCPTYGQECRLTAVEETLDGGAIENDTLSYSVRRFTVTRWTAGPHAIVTVRTPEGDPNEQITLLLASELARAATRR